MTPTRHTTSRAFTLVEMLIVITVIAVALVAIIPAFGRIAESASFASSVNRTTSTLSLARALAMESGRQTGVVFLYDAETERTTLLIVERTDDQGVIPLANASGNRVPTPASVFVPSQASPVPLPRGVGVYGLALTSADANPAPLDPMARWYPNEARHLNSDSSSERFWIFPRNDPRIFINEGEALEDFAGDYAAYPGSFAVSFFVRFSETGSIVSASSNSATDPVNSFLEYPDLPRDPSAFPGTPQYATLDQARVFDPHIIFDSGGVVQFNPEVRLRSVDLIAIVDVVRLGEGTGVREPRLVRPEIGQLVDAGDDPRLLSANDPKAQFLDGDLNNDLRESPSQIRRISRWIDANAEILGFNPHNGAVLRRVSR